MDYIKNFLPEFEKKMGFGKAKSLDVIVEKWREIASGESGKGTTPFKVKDGILYLYADNSAVLSEVTYKKKELISKVNAFLKTTEIKEIKAKLKQ